MNQTYKALVIDPDLKSWIQYSENTDFPIQNLPLGVFSHQQNPKRIGSIIGDQIIDLSTLTGLSEALGISNSFFTNDQLNPLLTLGKEKLRGIRRYLSEVFSIQNHHRSEFEKSLIPLHQVKLHLPVHCGDYTDFYSSKEHATNVGIMFRDPANALLPNWLHIPVGYHGRASSIVVSGTPVVRPAGQIVTKEGEAPIYSKSRQLDFELEMAFVIGQGNELAHPIPISKTKEYIHGLILFNDWSARDIQKWEYVPLGPFLGKNFCSTVSPWLIDLDALEPFMVSGPDQNPPILEYLHQAGKNNYNIELEVLLNGHPISHSNTKYLYWSMFQQLAHHTVNGCNMRIGDICASGTISGPTPDSYGSMLELAWKGTKPIALPDGSTRVFLQDGDELELKAFARGNGYRIGFGECKGMVVS
ncbi:MAG: fumarylacetoacetase [Saprospiraceae bacterium]|nr:fumarylacetoacetase [Saprospiraceae bacterium]